MTTSTKAGSAQASTTPSSFMSRCWAVVMALLVVALLPMFARSHLEGFTYMTETMSLVLPQLDVTDPIWTTNVSYFYLSRPGTVWLMAPLSALVPGQGYDILVWLATPVFLTSLVIVTKLWSQASWLSSVATLLFIPIALDVNFYLNDNIVAAAFTLTGLALLLWSQKTVPVFAAGALLSVGLLCRLDQILFIPLFIAFAGLGAVSLKIAVARLIALIAGFAAIHALMWSLDPSAANLLARVQVVSNSDALWARGESPMLALFARDLSAMTVAFAAATPAVIAGIVIMQRRARDTWHGLPTLFDRQFAGLVALILYPLAIYVVTFGKYYDPRGFLSILPFVAPLVAMAIEHYIVAPLRTLGPNMRIWVSQTALIAILMVVPVIIPGLPLIQAVMPVPSEGENAPRSLTGRLWYAGAWSRWQDRFRAAESDMTAVLKAANSGASPTIIVSTSWTPDRLLQNELAVSGFVPAQSQTAVCSEMAEIWSHPDGSTVYHLRTHVPFLPDVARNSAAIYKLHSEPCLRSVPEAQRLSISPFAVAVSWPRPDITLSRYEDGVFRISDADLDALSAVAVQSLTLANSSTDISTTEFANDVLDEISAVLN